MIPVQEIQEIFLGRRLGLELERKNPCTNKTKYEEEDEYQLLYRLMPSIQYSPN